MDKQKGILLGGMALLTGALAWAYWPTLTEMVRIWNREPDYSHGFLVPLISGYLLWIRRASMPPVSVKLAWGGLVLLLASAAVRFFGGLYFVDALDGWSLPIWIGGVCWFLLGRKFFVWALPGIVFLWFMVPLPFRVEHALSRPLQSIASMLSCWLLQSLGQPALAEGNVITLGENRLEVDLACSGLRMFMSFVALGVAYALIMKRPAWQKITVLICVVPIALISNALRITATGLLYQYVGGDWARAFSHDAAGWVMIPVAASFLGLLLWYLNHLVIEVETVSPQVLVRRGGEPA